MKFVEPIRDPKKISQIKNILHDEWNLRDFLLFTCWINFWLRISDLLCLKISDLFDSEWDINEYFEIREKKTGKWNKIWIGEKVKNALNEYIKMYPFLLEDCENYVFFAKKTYPLGSKAIWRNQSYKLIQKWTSEVWLKWRYWTHSFRKTLWFTALRNNIPVEFISQRFNHSSGKITSLYLGVTKEETMEAFLKLDV
jgi:site-specific recombinase XerD